MDPWGSEAENTVVVSEFEDNFQPTVDSGKLSDSEQYLAILERKLKAIRSKNKVVENLSAYRADCIDRLLREGCDLDPVVGDTEEEKLLQEYAVYQMGRKSLFIFLMGLAWKCRFSMPLLLSGTVAVLGRAWMFQIRMHTVHRLHENELAYYDEDEEQDEDDGSWETESTDSWETIVEEVAYG